MNALYQEKEELKIRKAESPSTKGIIPTMNNMYPQPPGPKVIHSLDKQEREKI